MSLLGVEFGRHFFSTRWGSVRGDFETLIQIRINLFECNPGHYLRKLFIRSKICRKVRQSVVFNLQPRHWRALFIGMGQDYDPTWHFTVADLLSFNLGRYKDLIAAVCSGATAEYALEQQLERLIRGWQEKDFKLAKHIPLMRPRIERESKKSVKEKRKNIRPGQNSGVSDCCRSQASSDCFRFLDSLLSLSRHSILTAQYSTQTNP